MRARTLVPIFALLFAACGDDPVRPEPARCFIVAPGFDFGFYLLPLADQRSREFDGTIEISNQPANVVGAGAEPLPISLSMEMITELPNPPLFAFGSPQTELLIPAFTSTEVSFTVTVTENTSPGLHRGRITFSPLCGEVQFQVELEGRPVAPPVFVETIGGPGEGLGEFDSPEALVFDDAGRALVADQGNDRIQVFNPEWNPLFTIHDVEFFSDLSSPTGIAVGNDLIVVGDHRSGGRIAVFDMTGATIESFGNGRPAPQFSDLQRVDLDGEGLIYVTDGVGQRVEVFRLTGVDVGWEKVMQWGSGGDGPGQFHLAYGLRIRDNEVWVSDQGGDRINRFSLTGEFLSRWGERGTNGGKFKSPRGIAFTADGNLLVVDSGNQRVQMLTPDGEFLTSWGATRGPAVMESPRDVAVDTAGDIYVVDGVGANRILRFRFQ